STLETRLVLLATPMFWSCVHSPVRMAWASVAPPLCGAVILWDGSHSATAWMMARCTRTTHDSPGWLGSKYGSASVRVPSKYTHCVSGWYPAVGWAGSLRLYSQTVYQLPPW